MPAGGILTSGKDFVLTSGKKLNSHQWERRFIPLVRKNYFPTGENLYEKKFSPVGRKWRKGEERGGRGRKGPISNAFRLGFESKSMEMRSKARMKSYTLYFGLQQGIC